MARSGVGTRHGTARPVAERLAPLLDELFPDGAPVRFSFWDGSEVGAAFGAGRVVLRTPRALQWLFWSPNEIGLARAYVAGDLEVHGDLGAVLSELRTDGLRARRPRWSLRLRGVQSALRLGLISFPPSPPEVEMVVRGRRHSKGRDAAAIAHHYDVGNDFYRLVLGPTMTYSCARFVEEHSSLDEAQRAKHDLVCRKLGLHERSGVRLLDVGCGWGSMALHAAANYGARVVAITLSSEQADAARERIRGAGLEGSIEVRLADYRDLRGETFDAISSVGMFEHVGRERMQEYFEILFSLLAPRGRLLNHAISSPGGSVMEGKKFIHRYVFPDGDLLDVAVAQQAMERVGFEIRDVESLREHYVRTLRAWVGNLEERWDEAVELVGVARARVWRLYMAASANAFAKGAIAVHQVLGVRPDERGGSGMPATRSAWS